MWVDYGKLVLEIDPGRVSYLMTRFREEVYQAKWYKRMVKNDRDHQVRAKILQEIPAPEPARQETWWAGRTALYRENVHQGQKKQAKQGRMI